VLSPENINQSLSLSERREDLSQNRSSIKSVLIVDDDPRICDFSYIAFAREDFNVFTANNSKEALKIYENNSINTIVTDNEMGADSLSGIDMLYKMFIEERREKTFAILRTSGQFNSDQVDKAAELFTGGFLDLLYKKTTQLSSDIKSNDGALTKIIDPYFFDDPFKLISEDSFLASETIKNLGMARNPNVSSLYKKRLEQLFLHYDFLNPADLASTLLDEFLFLIKRVRPHSLLEDMKITSETKV